MKTLRGFSLVEFFIICIVVAFIVGGCVDAIKEDSADTNQQTTQQTQEQRQKRLDVVNNLIKESQKTGLIKGFNEYTVGNEKYADVVVNEYIWNQLPNETKQQICFMFQEYTELTGVKIPAFKGYTTGKTMMAFASSIHNF